MAFSDSEVERYARHLVLREIGGAGQQKLKAARVLMVGMGALGSAAAPMLVAAGVGALGLVDGDVVGLSNLQRQVLYATPEIGARKVDAAVERLRQLNPEVRLNPHPVMLDDRNAADLVGAYDLVLDGTDDFGARFAVNAACVQAGRPLVSGALERGAGPVGLFAAGVTRGRPLAERQPCYRCLTPEAPPGAETCARVGVMGALAGVIGAMMTLEALKWIAGAGQPLAGRLLIYDALAGETRTVRLSPDPACPTCGEGASSTLM